MSQIGRGLKIFLYDFNSAVMQKLNPSVFVNSVQCMGHKNITVWVQCMGHKNITVWKYDFISVQAGYWVLHFVWITQAVLINGSKEKKILFPVKRKQPTFSPELL